MSTQPSPLPEFNTVWQETLKWHPSVTQQSQFQRLYERILEGNQHLNLTRITQPEEFWEKHLWDSLRGVADWLSVDENAQHNVQETPETVEETAIPESGEAETHPDPFNVIDIGSGAGFPGIPVAIARPNWQVTLLDSTRKKVTFLDALLSDLKLDNTQTCTARAEQAGRDRTHRERYGLALVRAVGTASACAEYALPFVNVGGLAVLYRGQWTEEEAAGLEAAVSQLGGAIDRIEAFATPLSQSIRHTIHLRKVAPISSEFPRPVGIAAQRPL